MSDMVLQEMGSSEVDPRGRRRRPFGLKAIMTLLVLQIIAGLLAILFFVIAMNLPPDIPLDELDDLVLSMPFYVAQQSVLAVLRLVCLFGLWRLKRWAWFLMMLLLTYSMAVDIVAFFRGNPIYIAMLLNVAMVFYLNQREVQELF
ncbi:MAG: DUF2127 domain-containing protein, partial [Caldilineaceae bacterium]|nr:DUF2127 domain-containing protein [Caldilineaceae bacterium]